jgi:hypothetical protein
VQQRGWGDDQDGAGLGFAGGSWRQQQAEVAVGDPAGLQGLAEGVGAELVHCPPPDFLAMDAAGSGYPAHQDVDLKQGVAQTAESSPAVLDLQAEATGPPGALLVSPTPPVPYPS